MAPSANTPTEDTSVELVPFESMDADEIVSIFRGDSDWQPAPVDVDAVTEQILRQYLGAESQADVWKGASTFSTKDLAGAGPFQVEDLHVYRSRYENPTTGKKGAFLACPIVILETGEQAILNTSAIHCVGKLLAFKLNGWLPARFLVEERGQSAAGYTIYDLKPA